MPLRGSRVTSLACSRPALRAPGGPQASPFGRRGDPYSRPADVDRAHFPEDALALSQRLEPLEAYEREPKEQRLATSNLQGMRGRDGIDFCERIPLTSLPGTPVATTTACRKCATQGA